MAETDIFTPLYKRSLNVYIKCLVITDNFTVRGNSMLEIKGMALMADSWMVKRVVIVVAGPGTVLTGHPKVSSF